MVVLIIGFLIFFVISFLLKMEYFEENNITNESSLLDIRKVYKKLSLLFHPDKHFEEQDKDFFNGVMIDINTAYEKLIANKFDSSTEEEVKKEAERAKAEKRREEEKQEKLRRERRDSRMKKADERRKLEELRAERKRAQERRDEERKEKREKQLREQLSTKIKNDWLNEKEYEANVAARIKRENMYLSDEDQIRMQQQRDEIQEKKMACREKKMQREGCWSLSDSIQVASIRLWEVEKKKEDERRKLWREKEKRAEVRLEKYKFKIFLEENNYFNRNDKWERECADEIRKIFPNEENDYIYVDDDS